VHSTADKYILFGHSAGAQFVHRFMLFMPSSPLQSKIHSTEEHKSKSTTSEKGSSISFPRVSLAISANAGFYTMPNQRVAFPYGLKKTVLQQADIDLALSRRMLILLGDADTDPNHKSLRRTEKAMAQGKHRFERGQNFFKAAQQAHDVKSSSNFNWTMKFVPDVAHDSNGMCLAAVNEINTVLSKL